MPRSFLVKTKQQQQQQRHDVIGLAGGDIKANVDEVRTSIFQQLPSLPCDTQSQFHKGMIQNERMGNNSVIRTNLRQPTAIDKTMSDGRMECSRPLTQMSHQCNVTLQSAAAAAAAARSHLATIMTSSHPLFPLYPDALAWLRQLHAMCACTDRPLPLPPPAAVLPPPHRPMTSEEPVYYVTKMAAGVAPMQPFDPRWSSCPSPAMAPSVEVATTTTTRSVDRGTQRRRRDFSIPSILSDRGSSSGGGSGGSSTGADSESEERCRSTSSSVDEPCSAQPRRHVVTSYDHVTRAPAELLRRRQLDIQRFECPQCNKVYGTMGSLKMHVRTHTLPCRCPLCGKAFSRPWLLQGHVRTHTGERPFRCPDCDRAFADRSNLRAHLQTHAGIKRYRCHVCDKPFSRMSLLAKHQGTAACRVVN